MRFFKNLAYNTTVCLRYFQHLKKNWLQDKLWMATFFIDNACLETLVFLMSCHRLNFNSKFIKSLFGRTKMFFHVFWLGTSGPIKPNHVQFCIFQPKCFFLKINCFPLHFLLSYKINFPCTIVGTILWLYLWKIILKSFCFFFICLIFTYHFKHLLTLS